MKLIKQFIVLFVCATFPFTAYNQEFGVKVGTQFSINLNQFNTAEKQPKLGWHLGIYYSTLHPVGNLQVEFQASKERIGLDDVLRLNLYYTRLGFLYKRKIASNWHFIGGLQFGLFMGGDLRSNEKIGPIYPVDRTIVSTYKFDLGIPIGLLVDIHPIKLAFRVNLALINREDNFQNASLGVSLYYTGHRRHY